MGRTQICGHRGASALVPHENTLAAFGAAAEVGASWVELDVRRLGDGSLVVLHDPAYDGILLSVLSLETLRERADAHGHAVPTLREALTFCRGRIRVDIEIKEPGTEDEVAGLAREILEPGRYAYTAFDDPVIARLGELDPDAERGLLLGHPEPASPLLTRLTEVYPIQRLRGCGATFAVTHYRLLRMGFLRRLRSAGYPVWVWTVNEPARMRRLLQAPVACIITDHPDVAVALRDELQGPGEAVEDEDDSVARGG